MSESGFLWLQATIGGMGMANNRPESVFAGLDRSSGAILVDRSETLGLGAPVRRDAAETLVATNILSSKVHDVLFTEEHIADAIRAYFSLQSEGLLHLENEVQRHQPQAKIEPDGMDEHGLKYRFAPDITNGQFAVVVLCWLVRLQAAVAQVEDAVSGFGDVHAMTFGLPPEYLPTGASPFGVTRRGSESMTPVADYWEML